jgi:hypothetical protein
VLQQNALAKSLDKQYEIIYSTVEFEFNTAVVLAILMERDFLGADVGQSCGCETAQGDSTEITVF